MQPERYYLCEVVQYSLSLHETEWCGTMSGVNVDIVDASIRELTYCEKERPSMQHLRRRKHGFHIKTLSFT